MAKRDGVLITRESAQELSGLLRRDRLGTQPIGRSRSFGGSDFGRVIVGKTDASHAKGASGVVSVYDGATQGSETDTGDNVTAWNYFGAIDSGKWVAVVETVRGYIILSAEMC